MVKTKKKIDCDSCGKSINARLKVKKVGEVELTFLWCAKCKTVYPSYVIDRNISKNIEETKKLQEQVFGKNRSQLVQGVSSQEDIDTRVKENALIMNRIRNLKKENVLMTRTLIQTHMKAFESIGDRVIYNG